FLLPPPSTLFPYTTLFRSFLIFIQINILPGRHLVGILAVARDSTSCNDGSEIEVFTKLLSGIVKPSSQSEPSVIFMNKYVCTVQGVAIVVMRIKLPIACNLVVGMVVSKFAIVDDNAQGNSDNLTIIFYTNLPFGKCF